jgi:hypothetical protein
MRILLLNTNPVVSRLVELAVSSHDVEIEERAHLSGISRLEYDAVIVDDHAYDAETERFFNEVLKTDRVILLSGKAYGEEIGDAFDTVLKKPFLPAQIEALLFDENMKSSRKKNETISSAEDEMQKPETEKEEEEFLFFLEEAEEETQAAPVLDRNEVERIKALLEESEAVEEELSETSLNDMEAKKVEVITENLKKEGLEIVDEEEIVDTLTKKRDEGVKMDAETFIDLIASVKPKKLRKLLKGATVTLTIRFEE